MASGYVTNVSTAGRIRRGNVDLFRDGVRSIPNEPITSIPDPIYFFGERPFYEHEIEELKPHIAGVLTEKSQTSVDPESIQVFSGKDVHVGNYHSRRDLHPHLDVANQAIREFHQWGFNGESPKMPEINIPLNEGELKLSYGNDAVINLMRSFGRAHVFDLSVPGLMIPNPYALFIPVGGSVRRDQNRGVTNSLVLVSTSEPMQFLESLVSEYFHFKLGDATSRNILNDPRMKNLDSLLDDPQLDGYSESEKQAYLQELKKQVPNGMVPGLIKNYWIAMEEGLVHAATFSWMRHINRKHKLGLTEDHFEQRREHLSNSLDCIANYGRINDFRRVIEEEGLLSVVEAYERDGQEFFAEN